MRKNSDGLFPNDEQDGDEHLLKGYQWPFDPQRIENLQSSLIDILVFNETQKGRRVFMDFLHNQSAATRWTSSISTPSAGSQTVSAKSRRAAENAYRTTGTHEHTRY
jgi:hypothetical protein